MQIFEDTATFLAFLSLGVLFLYIIIALIIHIFGSIGFDKKIDKFYFSIGTYFCLPVYGLAFVSKGVAEKIERRDPILSFILAAVFFLTMFILINRKKIWKK